MSTLPDQRTILEEPREHAIGKDGRRYSYKSAASNWETNSNAISNVTTPRA